MEVEKHILSLLEDCKHEIPSNIYSFNSTGEDKGIVNVLESANDEKNTNDCIFSIKKYKTDDLFPGKWIICQLDNDTFTILSEELFNCYFKVKSIEKSFKEIAKFCSTAKIAINKKSTYDLIIEKKMEYDLESELINSNTIIELESFEPGSLVEFTFESLENETLSEEKQIEIIREFSQPYGPNRIFKDGNSSYILNVQFAHTISLIQSISGDTLGIIAKRKEEQQLSLGSLFKLASE